MTHSNPPEVVTQGDREAAASYESFMLNDVNSYIRAIRNGKHDSHPLVQAFARHRLRHTPDREAMARVISPTAFQLADELARPGSEGFHEYRDAKAKADEQTAIALAKADAIIAMIEGGGA